MTARESLQTAIRARLDAVADREHYARDPEGHLERLKSRSSELESLILTLPHDTDPQLMHFLERQSYLKALDWLSRSVELNPN